MNTPSGRAALKMAAEKNLSLQWEGWTVDLFACEDGSLGISVDQPNPGMSTDPDADTPFVDIFVTPGLEVSHDSPVH